VYFDQAAYDLKCEWGLQGLLTLESVSDAVVIVDVLSFSTAVDIALSNRASVLPCCGTDDLLKSFAVANGAILAGRRGTKDEYTLSPASLLSIPAGTLFALPSQNGSTLSLRATRVPVFTACLRNALAVAKRAAACGSRITVIPAGEQWQESALRPSLEDLIGAGSVLAELPGTVSAEAEMAIAVFMRFRQNLRDALCRCGSGRELVEKGFGLDVELAAEYAVSSVAPMLVQKRFNDAWADWTSTAPPRDPA
jgi:2-phosphosulfolactate phosphatase